MWSWCVFPPGVSCILLIFPSANDVAQLNCMKSVPPSTLRDAISHTNISFNLVVDSKYARQKILGVAYVRVDITLFPDFRDRAAAGNFLRVPLLSGTTQHESDIIAVAQQELALGFAPPVVTELLSDLQTQVFIA